MREGEGGGGVLVVGLGEQCPTERCVHTRIRRCIECPCTGSAVAHPLLGTRKETVVRRGSL
jgi:hypothetical protein